MGSEGTVPAATHLIDRQHGGTDVQRYADERSTYCFCEHEGPSQPAATTAISHDYFSECVWKNHYIYYLNNFQTNLT